MGSLWLKFQVSSQSKHKVFNLYDRTCDKKLLISIINVTMYLKFQARSNEHELVTSNTTKVVTGIS